MERINSENIRTQIENTVAQIPETNLTSFQRKFLKKFQDSLHFESQREPEPSLKVLRQLTAEAIFGVGLSKHCPTLLEILQEIGIPGKPRRF